MTPIDEDLAETVDAPANDAAKEAGLADVADHGVWSRLYHGETNFNFVGRWKLWFSLSGGLLVIGLIALAASGLNLGIDFTGGTVWEVDAGKAEITDVESAMGDLGYQDVQVQLVTQNIGSGDEEILRVEAEATAAPTTETTDALAQASNSLESLAGDFRGESQAQVLIVRGQLDGIEGPFEGGVPDELVTLQDQVKTLSETWEDSDDATALVTTSSDEMQATVQTLADLEQSERERVGQAVSDELSGLTGVSVSEVTVDTVGPSWGKQVSEKARTALIVFLLAILLYITLRFEFRMAVATVAALLHDLIIVVGVYAVFQFPVTPATVIAVLTILGFSIYDGIVVFDRVDENTRLLGRKAKMTYSEMANMSLNQVLMRSLNTSITALLPIVTVLLLGAFVLGATTLQEFGLALFLGLLSGAYSSIFIATPMLALLKEREPRYTELRERLANQASGTEVAGSEPKVAVEAAAVTSSVTPRPRKAGRKR
jgi:preprotein translocase subunit SecF